MPAVPVRNDSPGAQAIAKPSKTVEVMACGILIGFLTLTFRAGMAHERG
jgi:hypothetical protein